MSFDPFKDGGAVEVSERPTEGFDPFASGAAEAHVPEVAQETNSAPNVGTDWVSLYAGMEGMDQRLPMEQRASFAQLDAVSDNSKAARAQAINQAYLATKLPELDHATMERNWPAVRTAYAKQQFGMVDKDVTDTSLYGAISKRLKEQTVSEVGEESQLKPWTWKNAAANDVLEVGRSISHFWEAINKPAAEIPEAPKDLPDLPMLGLQNPALAGGVWNALAPMLSQATTSPLGIATLGAGPALAAAAKTYPLARAALASMTGIFTGLMGYGTVKSAIKLPDVLKDPNATFQDRVTAVSETVADAGATLLGAVGTALELFPPEQGAQVAKELEGKNPTQAAEIMRQKAAETDIPAHNEALNKSAEELDRIAAPDFFNPSPEPELLKENTTLQDLIGKKIRYEGYGGVLIRDAEGNFHLLKETFKKGSPNMVEISETGKSPDVLAHDVGVVPEQGFEYRAKPGETVKASEPEASPAYEEASPTAAKPAGATETPTGKEGAGKGTEKPATGGQIGIKNETMEAELEKMGLPGPTKAESMTFKGVVADVDAEFKADNTIGQKLVAKLDGNPRELTPKEEVTLGFEANRLRLERDAAERELEAAQAAGDASRVMDAKIRIENARADFEKLGEVADKTGTKAGQALAFRKVMLKEDYSLAAMERRRALAEGKPLSEEQSAEVRDLHKKLTEAQTKLDAYEAAKRKAASEPLREAPRRAKPTSRVSKFLTEQADAARSRIKERAKSERLFSGGIDPEELTDYAVIGADYIAKGVVKFADWSTAMVNELGDAIKPHLDALFRQAVEARDQASKLQAYKTRTATETEKLKAKLESGDLSKAERKKLVLDPEAQKLRAEYQRVKDMIDVRTRQAELKNRSPMEKIGQGFLNLRKVGLISGIKTLGKVGIAGQTRIASTIADSTVAALLNKLPVIGEIAKGAPREGGTTGSTTANLAKGYAEGWLYAADQAWEVLKSGKTDAEVVEGATRGERSFINYLVNTHALAKLPAFAQEYKISLRERTAFELRKGTDMTNPVNQMRVNSEAVRDGLRAKFQQDNFVTKRFNMLVRSLEKSSEHQTSGKVIAGVLNFMFPIVKIPSNWFAEGATYSNLGLGVPRAAVKTLQALKNGVENLTPVQRDSIMRHWKKGSLGGGLMLLGYYLRNDIGGYYQPSKQDPNKPEFGGIRIYGENIPRWMIHMPILEPLHFGATIGHVMDHINKKTGESPGVAEATVLAATGLLDEIPYVSNARNATQALDADGRGQYARGELIKSALVPRLLQDVAEFTDTDKDGKPIKRKPATIPQHIETAIPGLRENVPQRDITTTFRQ